MNKFFTVIIAMGMSGITYGYQNNWTGFYAGVDAGLVFNNAQLTSQQLGFTNPGDTCSSSSDFTSFTPGIQFGYLNQLPNNVVSGIEASVSFNTNQKQTFSCKSAFNPDVYDGFTFRNQLQTSLKARVGHTLIWNKQSLLPYLTAGASLARVGLTYQNEGGDYYSQHNDRVGWLIGAGLEWAFRQNWSLRAEYYYLDYGNNTIKLNIPAVYGLDDPDGNARIHLSSNNLVVAINYWI